MEILATDLSKLSQNEVKPAVPVFLWYLIDLQLIAFYIMIQRFIMARIHLWAVLHAD